MRRAVRGWGVVFNCMLMVQRLMCGSLCNTSEDQQGAWIEMNGVACALTRHVGSQGTVVAAVLDRCVHDTRPRASEVLDRAGCAVVP